VQLNAKLRELLSGKKQAAIASEWCERWDARGGQQFSVETVVSRLSGRARGRSVVLR
jgi:hypothetical protein